jgi:hypothetical protein
MSDFDQEASTGGGYERSVALPVAASDGIAQRIILRFRGRRLERVSVILEEVRAGQHGSLIRYDDAHGRFHRHSPGWPEPSGQIEAYFDLPVRRRATFSESQIRVRYTIWEARIFGSEGNAIA